MIHPFRPTMIANDRCHECGEYEEDGAHMDTTLDVGHGRGCACGCQNVAEPCEHLGAKSEDIADGVIGNGAAHVLAAHCADCGADLVDDGEMDEDGTYRPSWSIL